MTQTDTVRGPDIDLPTLVGLVLLLSPVLTMVHELAGHALTCIATGHMPTVLGAYYVECPSATGMDGRLVAMAGTAVDALAAILAYMAWRASRAPILRMTWWIVYTVKGMVAAGYWLFSGVMGLGDWAPGATGGMGIMAHPWAWRVLLTLVGLVAYIAVTRLSMRGLDDMLGANGPALAARKRVAMTVYLVGGSVAVLVGLFNPIGIVIVLVSAVASTFGGTAGLFNVAFRAAGSRPAQYFVLGRHRWLLLAGMATATAFALVLGPSLTLA